jgi:hypothetical protein
MTTKSQMADFTYSETREENIADFFTKELPTQPTNIIKDEDEPLSAESPQGAGTVYWDTYLSHTYRFLP